MKPYEIVLKSLKVKLFWENLMLYAVDRSQLIIQCILQNKGQLRDFAGRWQNSSNNVLLLNSKDSAYNILIAI